MKRSKTLKRKLGQNTAEYLIMLTLIAVGSIGLFTAFGKTIHAKLAFLSAAISGDQQLYDDSKELTSNAAKAAIQKTKKVGSIKMEGIDQSQLIDTFDGSAGRR